jgi:hypothetical protein
MIRDLVISVLVVAILAALLAIIRRADEIRATVICERGETYLCQTAGKRP